MSHMSDVLSGAGPGAPHAPAGPVNCTDIPPAGAGPDVLAAVWLACRDTSW
jgi:hypothetical protein